MICLNHVSAALAMLCTACAATAGAAEMSFLEVLSEQEMLRETRLQEFTASQYWQESLPGHPDFGVATERMEYEHSVLGIEPPARPNGTILSLRLQLYVCNQADGDVELVLDSLALDRANRRRFLIGPREDDSVSVEESLLANGKLRVVVQTRNGKRFTVRRSVLNMDYRPPVPTDAIRRDEFLPRRFELVSNYPNPFHPPACISYVLPAPSQVHLEIFDTRGHLVRSFAPTLKSAGSHALLWDGTNASGVPMASGVYMYRVTTDREGGMSGMMQLN